VALTFLIVNLAWVFFRADDLPAALRYLSSLFNLNGSTDANALLLRAVYYDPGHA
jgi:D-alanyl-lipoteichoic acid acyltransferase DltB (MBOAT superfamily)